MGSADLFCGPLLQGFNNAERVNRYRKAYPEDTQTDEQIIQMLDMRREEKRQADKLINRLIRKYKNDTNK